MKSPAVRAEIESALGSRFGLTFQFRAQRAAPETMSTGLPEVDLLTGGLPRGAVTEIFGPASSGRSSLLASILAGATTRQEVCALVDSSDALDPTSAAASGVDLSGLLWIRCAGNPEHALQATDWLLQGGGFGIVVLDLGDISPLITRRIPMTSWFRLRRAIENTPTVLLLIEQEPHAKCCSSLMLEIQKERVAWSGSSGCSQLLRGAVHRLAARKPVRSATAVMETQAVRRGARSA